MASNKHNPMPDDWGRVNDKQEKHSSDIAGMDRDLAVVKTKVDSLNEQVKIHSIKIDNLTSKVLYLSGGLVLFAALASFILNKVFT